MHAVVMCVLTMNKNVNKEKFNIHEKFFILLITISTIVWFVKAPILRYGLSYVILFLNLPFLLLLKKIDYDFSLLKKYFNIFFVLLLFFLFTKNIYRISNLEMSNGYTDTLVPVKKYEYKEIKHHDFTFYAPISGVCGNAPTLCTVFSNQLLKSDFKFIKKGNNLMIKKNKK